MKRNRAVAARFSKYNEVIVLKKAWKFLSYVLVAALATAVTLFAVCGVEGIGAPGKLGQLEALILDRFIGETDQIAMEDAAASAMIGVLGDRWSYYISADDYQSHQEQMDNAYVGVGVTIQIREDGTGIDIVEVSAGGSAEEAGVQVGDILIAVDGQSILEMDTSQVRNMVRGEENTKLSMTFLRDGRELTLELTRKTIRNPVATGMMLDHNIGLVTIENFDSRCRDESVAAIESLLEQGAKALIFDVRFNPGGYRHELVSLLDYLLPEGELFRSEDYAGKVEVDKSDANCLDIPMAVLVNGDSYSAAEFFAAALSEYDAAVVVGEQTCGKGYFQQTFRLSDGSAVGLSVGKYYTPKGVSLAETGGLIPDIPVEVDEQTAYAIYTGTQDPAGDPQIQAAIASLMSENF